MASLTPVVAAESDYETATAWWNWNRETRVKRFRDLLNVPLFLEKYGAYR